MKENQFVITVWESHFGYNDLWNNFSILDVSFELEDAERRLKLFSDKAVIDGILHKKIEEKEDYVETEVPDYKKKEPMMEVFSPPNMQNKVVARIERAIYSKRSPQYDKSYYYLELVEFPNDTKLNPELFNPDRCKFEVNSFFDDTNKKSRLGIKDRTKVCLTTH